MARNQNVLKANLRPVFATNVRKIEPMGGGCIRIFLSVVRDREWVDRAVIEMPSDCAFGIARLLQETVDEFVESDGFAASRKSERGHG